MRVVGIDLDKTKVQKLQAGISYISDLNDRDVQALISGGKFEAASEYDRLMNVEAIIICVPTPLNEQGAPDLTYIEAAGMRIERLPLNGQLIVLESSTFPGTTEEVLLPILQRNGKKVGTDFYLAYSPERINPGDRRFTLAEMPKIISGVTPACLQRAMNLYQPVYQKVIAVSSPRAAEMAKVLENSQRFVNISFMNEVVRFCEKMNINVWEVIEAVHSKPYGNLYFYPGPGIGGHCIPVDPLYLQWKAREIGSDLEFIHIAKKVNDTMPGYIVDRLIRALPDAAAAGKSILLIGAAYKKDVNDLRESSSVQIMSLLIEQGANVAYHDPLIPALTLAGKRYESVDLDDDMLSSQDCVLIMVDHSELPLEKIVAKSRLLLDTRNATAKFGSLKHIIYL
jgi:UDP-N-acetyl-D-glucosamine dehydrogenase